MHTLWASSRSLTRGTLDYYFNCTCNSPRRTIQEQPIEPQRTGRSGISNVLSSKFASYESLKRPTISRIFLVVQMNLHRDKAKEHIGHYHSALKCSYSRVAIEIV